MSKLIDNLGVQSYCFRHFKENAKVAELVRECGLTGIEICGVHANFNEPESFAAVMEPYESAGVSILSIGVQGLDGKESERNYFEFCKEAGADFMSVDFHLPTLQQAVKTADALAEEFDLRLGIHNHGGRHALGSMTALDYVFSLCSDRIGLCLDTAWALDSGHDPVQMVKHYGSRLHGIHIKDFIFERNRRPADVVVGTGNLDLETLNKALHEVGFNGFAVLEYEGDVENPVPALKNCVTSVHDAMS